MLTIDQAKATAVLLAHHGWEEITQGSLTIDNLQLVPATDLVTEAEDYGFSCVGPNGKITGRISAVLAVRQSHR